MHEPVIDSIEELLGGGRLKAAAEAHLESCSSCRDEVAAMRSQSELFWALRVPVEAEPNAGFYARVMNRIETQAKPSIWSLFGESLFAKRLAYASMTFVVLLGTYVFSSVREEQLVANAPEAILAVDDNVTVTNADVERGRANLLVTLATYEE